MIDFENPQQPAANRAREVPEGVPRFLRTEDRQSKGLRPQIRIAIDAALPLLSIDIRILLVREAPLVAKRSPHDWREDGTTARPAARARSRGSRRCADKVRGAHRELPFPEGRVRNFESAPSRAVIAGRSRDGTQEND